MAGRVNYKIVFNLVLTVIQSVSWDLITSRKSLPGGYCQYPREAAALGAWFRSFTSLMRMAKGEVSRFAGVDSDDRVLEYWLPTECQVSGGFV